MKASVDNRILHDGAGLGGLARVTRDVLSQRQAFNEFVRSGHACDDTVDFDRATLDPTHPARFLSKYDSGDHLHPNDAGYQAMADAFNLKSSSRRFKR
jgi:lysophospholipase L1-like esterase